MIPVENTDFVGEGLGLLTSEYAGEGAPQLQGLISAFLAECQELESTLWDVIKLRQLANLTVYSPLVGTFAVINGDYGFTSSQDLTGILIPGLSVITFSDQPGTGYLVLSIDSTGTNFGTLYTYSGTTDFAATATQQLTNSLMDTVGALVGQPRNGLDDLDYLSTIYLRIAVNRSFAVPPNWSNFAAILLRTAGGPASYLEGPARFRLTVKNMTLSPNAVAAVLTDAVTIGVLGEFGYTTWDPINDFEFGSRWTQIVGYGPDPGVSRYGWGSRYDSTVGGLMIAAATLPPT